MAPTQYKNKYAFKSMQNLSDTYNLRIISISGAAGHGKGLIDAMSSFGAKSILRRDIVAFDVWFADSKEVCSYLTNRTDERISYSVVDPVSVDASRQCKDVKIIPGCMWGTCLFTQFIYLML